jgi:hypothetical protein
MPVPALPRSLRRSWALALAPILALGASHTDLRGQQRLLVPVTSSNEDHRAAALSPDGVTVAFLGPSKIAVVPYAGGAELMLAQSGNLTTFLWAPDSSGLFYLDGLQLRFVARAGGLSRLIATLPETAHALWDIERDGSHLYGTWLYIRNSGGNAIRETHVFVLATDGQSPPVTLVNSVLTIDGVQLSPDETKMVYREYDSTPFTPRDYIVANADGSNPVSLTGGTGLNINPGLPVWRSDGTGIYFGRIDRTLGKPILEQLSLTSTTPVRFTFTTASRNLTRAADARWVAYEGFWLPTQSWTPMLSPADGGGQVFLDPSRPLVSNGTPELGGLAGDRIVISGVLGAANFAQVLKVELARELRVSPRAVIGTTVGLDLPVAAGEAGLVFLSSASLPSAFALFGFAGGFWLDPTNLVTVLAGNGSGGSLTGQLPIPNMPILQNRAVYLQGIRITSATPTGDFTRLVELPIF